MPVTAFGDAGRSRMLLVTCALDAGHPVRAALRTPDKLGDLREPEHRASKVLTLRENGRSESNQ